MLKYLQRVPVINEKRYLYKVFQEHNLNTKGWIRNIQNILKLYGQDNLIQNIFKITEGEISENSYNPNISSFNRATDCYLQRTFYSYIRSTGNKNFFSELKKLYEKKNCLRLKKSESNRAISRLRLFSYKLASVTGKWYNIEKQKQIYRLRPHIAIGNEIHLLQDCPVYKDLRAHLFLGILETENIDLSYGNCS